MQTGCFTIQYLQQMHVQLRSISQRCALPLATRLGRQVSVGKRPVALNKVLPLGISEGRLVTRFYECKSLPFKPQASGDRCLHSSAERSSTMATGATVPLATYDLIETWIGQQRQASAPLTDKLRAALVSLESAIRTNPEPELEPELGDHNWVGLLQEYRAAYPFNGSQEVKFDERALDPSNRGLVRWKCQVTIGEEPEVPFPRADGSPPSFARKKDAKKYAAKCAVEWLRAKGYMPQNGVRFPKGINTPHQQQQQQPTQPKSQEPKVSSSSLAQGQTPSQPKKSPSPPARVPASPFDDSQPSAALQVDELCRVLGFHPPKYDIDSTGDGFYRGRADFGIEGDLLPFDVSQLEVVDNVISKKAAKEMIAENLLKHLRAEKEKRDASNQAFMAQYKEGIKE